jgi:hypothetical protein
MAYHWSAARAQTKNTNAAVGASRVRQAHCCRPAASSQQCRLCSLWGAAEVSSTCRRPHGLALVGGGWPVARPPMAARHALQNGAAPPRAARHAACRLHAASAPPPPSPQQGRPRKTHRQALPSKQKAKASRFAKRLKRAKGGRGGARWRCVRGADRPHVAHVRCAFENRE